MVAMKDFVHDQVFSYFDFANVIEKLQANQHKGIGERERKKERKKDANLCFRRNRTRQIADG